VRIRTTTTALFAVIAVTFAFDASNLLAPLDNRLLDAQFRLLRSWFPRPAAREVVVVGADEETAKRFPEPLTLWHGHLGKFLSAMVRARPSAVGLDIILPDRGFDAVLPGSDKLLLGSMLEARRVFPLVIGLTVDPAGKPRAIHPPFAAIAGAQGIGYALFRVDGDGRVRRFDERLGAGGEQVPTLAGQVARRLGVEPGAGLIDYWRGTPFDYVPLHQVIQWFDDNDRRSLEQAFGGKPVLLGMVLQYEDRKPVPVTLAASEPGAPDAPGVLLQAQALRNMLGSGFIQTVPKAGLAAAVVATALLWWVSAGTATVLLVFIAVTFVLAAGSTWLVTQGWFFPVAAPLLSAALALGGRNAVDTIANLRERRRLRSSFSGYVSPAVMDEILAGHIQPQLGGESKFVCALFSDIRGYTARSERMTPEQVIRFLNRYFEEVVARIHEHGGSVMSFMGDGIMAVFGAPKALDNPCREAFEAACAMLKYVAELNAQFGAEGEPPMEVGIGLHAGEAVIGHVGSSTRHDYTAIGDVINVASRLESLTKEAGYRVVASREVAERLEGGDALKYLGPMAIKGHSPVEVYGFDHL
jgi:class 3 adenylate cyclase